MARCSRMDVLGLMMHQGLVPLAYVPNLDVMRRLVSAVYQGGGRLFEFTNRGDGAASLFKDLLHAVRKEMPDLVVGVGSIVDGPTAGLYLSMGADFIVGSVFNPEVARLCNRRKVAYLPGCATATEISTAEEHGVEIVKIFPGGSVGGPAFVKAILGPTPWTKVLITGGVEATHDSIASWFGAGATAVGMGSNLFRETWIQGGDYDEISSSVSRVLGWIRHARGEGTGYRLDHVGLHPVGQVSGLDIATWYEAAFGLSRVEAVTSYILGDDRGTRIEVSKDEGDGEIHVAVAVPDFDEAVAELRGRGLEVEDAPSVGPEVKSAFLKGTDPAGHRVQIVWRHPS